MMPDREKVNRVNRAWECCNPFNRKCKECPYEKDCYHDGISRHMVADAVAMLKEQQEYIEYWSAKYDEIGKTYMNVRDERDALLKEREAVEPRVSTAEQRCGYCNKVIEMDGWKACPWCGKMIDWKRWWNKNGTHDNT